MGQSKKYSFVSLTTDFGLNDWFVGTMKAVIQSIAPGAEILDLTHGIPQGDVSGGAFALACGYNYFPDGTVHVAVVDPGVGGARHAIAVETERYCFVGPDNGVLSRALKSEHILQIRRLENPKYLGESVSQTFHGRDIFATVAGHLLRGAPPEKFGPAQKDYMRLSMPDAVEGEQGISGEVVYIDRFGNAITNIPNKTVKASMKLSGPKFHCPVAMFYQAVPLGKPVAVPGSTGFVEIAVNCGHAASKLKLRVGTKVKITTRSSLDSCG